MSGNSRSFGRFVLCGLWLPVVLAVATVVAQAWRISSKPQTYVSLAKLAAGGRVQMGGAGVGDQEHRNDIYGTIIEPLESSAMLKLANERVRLLYPDLKKADIEVRVTLLKGSAILTVAVIGSDRQYVQVFLNALLDEFKAFDLERQRNKAEQGNSVTVMERASRAVEDIQPRSNIMIVAGGAGLAVGVLLLLLSAVLWVATGPRQASPPPLPAAP